MLRFLQQGLIYLLAGAGVAWLAVMLTPKPTAPQAVRRGPGLIAGRLPACARCGRLRRLGRFTSIRRCGWHRPRCRRSGLH